MEIVFDFNSTAAQAACSSTTSINRFISFRLWQPRRQHELAWAVH
jgi:hypothetical protein